MRNEEMETKLYGCAIKLANFSTVFLLLYTHFL